MKIDYSDSAGSLRSRDAVNLRLKMLDEPHIAPLRDFVLNLREKHPSLEFPDFDPLDGGCNADILFLFEKPGPMTSADGKGSGFISQNNDDPTAKATFNFMKKAGLLRKRAIFWNVIPGWNGTRKVTRTEIRAGVDELNGLLSLLPKLRTIVLVGQKAKQAKPLVPQHLRVFESAHPSPIVFATQPDKWREIPIIWAQARED